MNNDSKLIFEAYISKKNLLNELDYGASDFGGAFGGIIKKAKTGDLPGKGYLIGNIASSLGISMEEAANKFTSAVFSNLFKQQKSSIGGKEVEFINPAKNKDQFLVEIKKAITKALEALKTENPNLKIPGSEAVKGYTARIIANLGEFISDAVTTTYGTKVNVTSAKDLKKAVVKSEPAKASETESANDVYVRSDARFIKDYQKIFAEMPDEITVKKGENIYQSDAFKDSVKDAIIQAYDVKTSNDKEFINDFVSSLEYKNAYVLSSSKQEKEGEGSGEISTLEDEGEQTPEDILRDLGTWDQASGFDEFDKFSTY
ncbi:hypothetical protein EBU95_14910 [bacterium]|nr:hypothetical protein [bacterium]